MESFCRVYENEWCKGLSKDLSRLYSLARNRGFYWLSYEIYGGVAGLYDFGPLGVMLKNNIMEFWRKYFIYDREGMVVEIETPVITPRIVLKASGHEDHFTDPVTECKKCGRVYRADHLIEDALGISVEGYSMEQLWKIMVENNIRCPEDGGELTHPKPALLLFKTEIGPYKGSLGYIRPETAQGIFVSFKHVVSVLRERLPIGIAQIGKVGRNEISPRQGLIRLREFTIMEIEFFFDPDKAWDEARGYLTNEILSEEINIVTASMKEEGVKGHVTDSIKKLLEKKAIVNPWLAYWMAIGNKFVKALGIPGDRIRFEEKLPHERAHYAQQTFDQQVYTEKFGWIEVAGYAYRTDYDLSRHIEYSKADLAMFRRFEKPIEKKVVKIVPDIYKIKRDYSDRIREIMPVLSRMSQDELLKSVKECGGVRIGELFLSKEYFIVKEEVVKVSGEKFVPHVVEPSYGLERLFYVVLEHSFTIASDGRAFLKLKPFLAPYKVAVFPLVAGSKDKPRMIRDLAWKLYQALYRTGLSVYYDDDGSIGKRYVRADEMGIPYVVTVDYQSLEDRTVTIRFRDTREQVRVHINELYSKLVELLSLKTDWNRVVKELVI